MFVTSGSEPTMNADEGWWITWIAIGPGHVRALCESTSPAYNRLARTIAASFRGQLWTTKPISRLTG